PLRTLEHLADLRVGEPFQLTQEYDRSVIGGQISDGLAHPAGDLGVARAREGLVGVEVVGRQGAGRAGVLVRVEGELRLLRRPPLLVHAQVVGDAVHPGVEGRLPLEAVEALVGLRERLLHDVERVFPAAQHAERQRGDLALVALDQLAESVAVARTRALDELPVARSHGTLAGGETGRRPAYSPAGRGGASRGASPGSACWSPPARRTGARRGRGLRARGGSGAARGPWSRSPAPPPRRWWRR